jgi:hypothetical protein
MERRSPSIRCSHWQPTNRFRRHEVRAPGYVHRHDCRRIVRCRNAGAMEYASRAMGSCGGIEVSRHIRCGIGDQSSAGGPRTDPAGRVFHLRQNRRTESICRGFHPAHVRRLRAARTPALAAGAHDVDPNTFGSATRSTRRPGHSDRGTRGIDGHRAPGGRIRRLPVARYRNTVAFHIDVGRPRLVAAISRAWSCSSTWRLCRSRSDG